MSHQLILELILYAVSIGCLYGAISTRLSVLEKKVDIHNHVVERMYKAEGEIETLKEKVEIYHDEKK